MARASLIALPAALLVGLAAAGAVLTLARRDWLACRIAQAQVVAASHPAGATAARDALLRQSGIEAIRVEGPGGPVWALAPASDAASSRTVDLSGETPPEAAWDAAGAVFDGADRLMRVTVPIASDADTALTVVVHRQPMAAAIGQAGSAFGLAILALTAIVALGVLAAFRAVLARPLGRVFGELATIGAAASHDRSDVALKESARLGPVRAADADLAHIRRALRLGTWRRARLAALEAAIGRLSHDLRGALSPAMLAAERLSGNADPVVVRTGDIVVRTVERAAELLRGPIDLVRESPAAGARARGALRPIVLEAALRARSEAPTLRVEAALDEAVEIEAERDSLVCVFLNLFRNAAAAGAREVRVVVEPVAGAFALTVADDGGGLPDAIRARAFAAPPAGTPGQAGMGLPIVRQIMLAHRGEASVVAAGPRGTTIQLSFPPTALRRAAGMPTAQPQSSPAPAPGG